MASIFQESITKLFNDLILHHLTVNADEKKALVLGRKYEENKIGKLKRLLYSKFYLALHAPYVIPDCNRDVPTNLACCNIYSSLEENILILKANGRDEDALKLSDQSETLTNIKDTAIEQVVHILLLLSKTSDCQGKSHERLCFKKLSNIDAPYFQFDNKAVSMTNDSVDHFGRITDADDDSFLLQETDVFSQPPGSFFHGASTSFLNKSSKESTHTVLTRSTLFSGLTNGLSSSMDIALNLPELPQYPAQRELSVASPKELSLDEGFDEPSKFSTPSSLSIDLTNNDISVWDEAQAAGELKMFAWDEINSYDMQLENLYITELGDKAFDCMYNIRISEVERIIGKKVDVDLVSAAQIYRDSLHALIGIPSSSYVFYPMSCSLKPKFNLHCSGTSIESLNGLTIKFAQVGTHYRQLKKFCLHHADKPITGVSGGHILKSFIDALNNVLYSYWSAVFMVEGNDGLTLMELWGLFDMCGRQLKFLADICLCSEAFKRTSRNSPKPKFPVGANLLSYLYSLAVKNSSTEQYPLLLFLFKSVSAPFIRLVSDWLFDGVCNDPYNEFFVHIDQQYLRYRDKHFWTQGFQMKQSKEAIPLFLDELADQIFACGKAINLLKLTNINHYLFERSIVPPPISITFSSVRLDSIEEKCREYVTLVEKMKEKDISKKEMERLKEKEEWKDKLNREKKITQNMIKDIEDLEMKVRIAIRGKKQEEYEDLKRQFESAMQERKERRVKKIEEDKFWLNEMKKVETEEDEIKQKAREELISFYEGLSRKAEAREFHAHWIIQRHELDDKRKHFLKAENDLIIKKYNSYKNSVLVNMVVDTLDGKTVGPESNQVVQSKPALTENSKDDQSDESATASHVNRITNIPVSPGAKSSKEFHADEGGEAKELLYPANIDDSPAVNSTRGCHADEDGEAKELLYPSNMEDSPPPVQSTRGLHGDDGGETKELLYPVNMEDSPLVQSTRGLRGDIGAETKELLYPANMEDAPLVQSTRGIHGEDGGETKELLYPVNMDDSPAVQSTRGLHGDEGSETKDLLYPVNMDDSPAVQSNRGLHGDEGSETKDLLYPVNMDDSPAVQSNRGLHGDEGSETKELLYPTHPSKAIFRKSTRGYDHDEGGETKELLYLISPIMNKPVRKFSKQNDSEEVKHLLYGNETINTGYLRLDETGKEESEAKSLLYPIDGDVTDGYISTRGHRVEGDETKRLLYSYEEDSTGGLMNRNTHDAASHSEGAEAKELLYPSSDVADVAQHGSRQFERPSTMQELLYPSEENAATLQQHVTREFERPTQIKKMMYPDVIKKEEATKEEKALTKDEVWMDSIVEPFRDEYSVLDLDPQPYLFGDTNQSIARHFDQSERDQNSDIMKQLPLETIIKRSLTIPIQAQVSLVNSAVVKYFLEDLRIEVHFDAFRKFLLLEDGEFGHSLCSQLFEKISSGMKPQEFCNTIRLNNIVIEALRLSLYASRIEYARQLTFSLKWMPDVFQASDVGALDFLELRYRVPWPCNIIVTENSITKYNKVFSFLLKLKKAGWSLQEVWVNLKKAGHDRVSASSPQLRQLQLYRHEMQHFVNNLERYIVNQIIHVSWTEFQHDLQNKVDSLDDLHRCHVNYLNKIIFRSLLSKNAAPVYKLINDIFGMIAKFEARLLTTSWKQDEQSGYVTHPLFSKLKAVHGAFKQCGEFLFSVISKLVRRGYQDHLDDLLLQVNFNAYYTTAVVKK